MRAGGAEEAFGPAEVGREESKDVSLKTDVPVLCVVVGEEEEDDEEGWFGRRPCASPACGLAKRNAPGTSRLRRSGSPPQSLDKRQPASWPNSTLEERPFSLWKRRNAMSVRWCGRARRNAAVAVAVVVGGTEGEEEREE